LSLVIRKLSKKTVLERWATLNENNKWAAASLVSEIVFSGREKEVHSLPKWTSLKLWKTVLPRDESIVFTRKHLKRKIQTPISHHTHLTFILLKCIMKNFLKNGFRLLNWIATIQRGDFYFGALISVRNIKF